jgi:formate-dependent nitrite reductase membrane component NrfD
MAVAFFSAEVGTGVFLISYLHDLVIGMVLGVALAGTLKPYFHLAHMGVPKKSIRALLRPDRSWISRGAIAIGLFVVPASFFLLNTGEWFVFADLSPQLAWLDTAAESVAVLAALVVICYQGFAMSHSESFTLWASPLLPLSSAAYALTAGCLVVLALGSSQLSAEAMFSLKVSALMMLFADMALVIGILNSARNKSQGGAFSVELLIKSRFAPWFRNLVLLLGLAVPALLLLMSSGVLAAIAACMAMLAGYMAFRILMFKAAVFEPISHDIAGRFGLV